MRAWLKLCLLGLDWCPLESYTRITLPFNKDRDLMDAGKGDGSVVCKRHAGSYFLSGGEIISAARAQSARPLACKWAGSGVHASRFVNCIVSGIVSTRI